MPSFGATDIDSQQKSNMTGWQILCIVGLTHKQLEIHGFVLSTVATDVLVLKHQAISIHSSKWIFLLLDSSNKKYYIYMKKNPENKIILKKIHSSLMVEVELGMVEGLK